MGNAIGIYTSAEDCSNPNPSHGIFAFLPYAGAAAGVLMGVIAPVDMRSKQIISVGLGLTGYFALDGMYYGTETGPQRTAGCLAATGIALGLNFVGIDEILPYTAGSVVGIFVIGPILAPLLAPAFKVGGGLLGILQIPTQVAKSVSCGIVGIGTDLHSVFTCNPGASSSECACWVNGKNRAELATTDDGQRVCRVTDCSNFSGLGKIPVPYPTCDKKAAYDALPADMCECFKHKSTDFVTARIYTTNGGPNNDYVHKQLNAGFEEVPSRALAPIPVNRGIGKDGQPTCFFENPLGAFSGGSRWSQKPTCSAEDNRLHNIYKNPEVKYQELLKVEQSVGGRAEGVFTDLRPAGGGCTIF